METMMSETLDLQASLAFSRHVQRDLAPSRRILINIFHILGVTIQGPFWLRNPKPPWLGVKIESQNAQKCVFVCLVVPKKGPGLCRLARLVQTLAWTFVFHYCFRERFPARLMQNLGMKFCFSLLFSWKVPGQMGATRFFCMALLLLTKLVCQPGVTCSQKNQLVRNCAQAPKTRWLGWNFEEVTPQTNHKPKKKAENFCIFKPIFLRKGRRLFLQRPWQQ